MKWKRNNSKENGESGEGGADEETKEESEASENEDILRDENEKNIIES